MYNKITCFVILLILSISSSAQNVEQSINNFKNIKNQQLSVTGGVNLGSAFYGVSGIDPRRDPFQWSVNLRLNLSFLGISAPFALNFSDGNQTFNLPAYTFTGFSPTYKWATVHLGDRSLNFSKYTFSGVRFRGIGVELKPSKFEFSAFYGSIRRATEEDLNTVNSLTPSYQRMGLGMKAGYRTAKTQLALILFNAEDQINSIATPTKFDVLPQENTIASFVGKQQIIPNLSIDFEWAKSGTNLDRQALQSQNVISKSPLLLGLFNPNSSGITGDAINAGLNYSKPTYGLRLGYERIDRGYRTLGSLFFNNDRENLTGQVFINLLENKLSLNVRGGLERSDLENIENNQTKRLVYAVQTRYAPTDNLNIMFGHSNFQNSTKLRVRQDPTQFFDSLFLAQVTQTTQLTTTYQIKNGSYPSTITLLLSQQNANSVLNDEVQNDANTSFINTGLIYSFKQTDRDYTISASINYNRTELSMFTTSAWSPSLVFSKNFLERKLQTSARMTYSFLDMSSGKSSVINFGLTGSYNIKSNHLVGAQLNFINRDASGLNSQSFFETFGRINYAYKFGFQKGKKGN